MTVEPATLLRVGAQTATFTAGRIQAKSYSRVCVVDQRALRAAMMRTASGVDVWTVNAAVPVWDPGAALASTIRSTRVIAALRGTFYGTGHAYQVRGLHDAPL